MNKVNRFSLEERYGYQNRKVIYDKDADNDIELNNIYPIIELLNKNNDQIAELKKQLAEHNEFFNAFNCKNFNEFKDFISTFMLTPHEEQTLIRELEQQLKDTEESYNNTMRYLNKTRSELLNLPKKIVGEIKENFDWRQCCEIRKYYDQQYIWFNYVTFNDFLDTILKKYGGENE